MSLAATKLLKKQSINAAVNAAVGVAAGLVGAGSMRQHTFRRCNTMHPVLAARKKTVWTLVIGRKKPDTVKYTIIQ